MLRWIIFFGFTLHVESQLSFNEENTELIGVFIVSRHADRTPERNQMKAYPNNIYINETFFPVGYGGLTNSGKKRSYTQGKYLRSRYGDLISKYYLPDEVKIKSTNTPRAIATAQVMLAALFEPYDVQKWNDELNWQPVPVWIADLQDPELMFLLSCRKWSLQNSRRFFLAPEGSMSNYSGLFQRLSKYTGPINQLAAILHIYDVLKGQENFGFPWPDWAEEMREEITEALHYYWISLFEVRSLDFRYTSGVLLNNILRDSAELINGTNTAPKFQYFATHDLHVSCFFKACRLPVLSRPGYASSLAVELRKDKSSGKYGYQFIYIDETGMDPVKLFPDGCEGDNICEYSLFKDLVSDFTLDEETFREECFVKTDEAVPKSITEFMDKYNPVNNKTAESNTIEDNIPKPIVTRNAHAGNAFFISSFYVIVVLGLLLLVYLHDL